MVVRHQKRTESSRPLRRAIGRFSGDQAGMATGVRRVPPRAEYGQIAATKYISRPRRTDPSVRATSRQSWPRYFALSPAIWQAGGPRQSEEVWVALAVTAWCRSTSMLEWFHIIYELWPFRPERGAALLAVLRPPEAVASTYSKTALATCRLLISPNLWPTTFMSGYGRLAVVDGSARKTQGIKRRACTATEVRSRLRVLSRRAVGNTDPVEIGVPAAPCRRVLRG